MKSFFRKFVATDSSVIAYDSYDSNKKVAQLLQDFYNKLFEQLSLDFYEYSTLVGKLTALKDDIENSQDYTAEKKQFEGELKQFFVSEESPQATPQATPQVTTDQLLGKYFKNNQEMIAYFKEFEKKYYSIEWNKLKIVERICPSFTTVNEGIKYYNDGIKYHRLIKKNKSDSTSSNTNLTLNKIEITPDRIEEVLEEILKGIKTKVLKEKNIAGAIWLEDLFFKNPPKKITDQILEDGFVKWHNMALQANNIDSIVIELSCLAKRMYHHFGITNAKRVLQGHHFASLLFSLKDEEINYHTNADNEKKQSAIGDKKKNSPALQYKKDWLNIAAKEFPDDLFWLNPKIYQSIVSSRVLESLFWNLFSNNLSVYESNYTLKIYPSIERARKILVSPHITHKKIIKILLAYLEGKKPSVSGDQYLIIFLNFIPEDKGLDRTYFNLAVENKSTLALLMNDLTKTIKDTYSFLPLSEEEKKGLEKYKQKIVELMGSLYLSSKELNLKTTQQKYLFDYLKNEINFFPSSVLHRDNITQFSEFNKQLARFLLQLVECVQEYIDIYDIYTAMLKASENSILIKLLTAIAKKDASGRADYLMYQYYLHCNRDSNKLNVNNNELELHRLNAITKQYPLALLEIDSYLIKIPYYLYPDTLFVCMTHAQFINKMLETYYPIMENNFAIMLLYFINSSYFQLYNRLKPQNTVSFNSVLQAYFAVNLNNVMNQRIAALVYLKTQIDDSSPINQPNRADAHYFYGQLLLSESNNFKNNQELRDLCAQLSKYFLSTAEQLEAPSLIKTKLQFYENRLTDTDSIEEQFQNLSHWLFYYNQLPSEIRNNFSADPIASIIKNMKILWGELKTPDCTNKAALLIIIKLLVVKEYITEWKSLNYTFTKSIVDAWNSSYGEYFNLSKDFLSNNLDNTLLNQYQSVIELKIILDDEEVNQTNNNSVKEIIENLRLLVANISPKKIEEINSVFDNIKEKINKNIDLICVVSDTQDKAIDQIKKILDYAKKAGRLNINHSNLVNKLQSLQNRKGPYELIPEITRNSQGQVFALRLFSIIDLSIYSNSKNSEILSYQKRWLELAAKSPADLFWLNVEVYALIAQDPRLENYFWQLFPNLPLNALEIDPNVDRIKKLLLQHSISDINDVSYLIKLLKEKQEEISGNDYFRIVLNLYQNNQDLDKEYLQLAENNDCQAVKLINKLKEKVSVSPRVDIISDTQSIKNKSQKEIPALIVKLYFEISELQLTKFQRESLWRSFDHFLGLILAKESEYLDVNKSLARYLVKIVNVVRLYPDIYDLFRALMSSNINHYKKSIILQLFSEFSKEDISGRTDYLLYNYCSQISPDYPTESNNAILAIHHNNAVKKEYPLALLNEISYRSRQKYPYLDEIVYKISSDQSLKTEQFILIFLNTMHNNFAHMLLYLIDSFQFKIYNELKPLPLFAFLSADQAYEIAKNPTIESNQRIAALQYLRSQIQTEENQIKRQLLVPKNRVQEEQTAIGYYKKLLSLESANPKNNPELNELLKAQQGIFSFKETKQASVHYAGMNFVTIEEGIQLYNKIKNADTPVVLDVNNNSELKQPSLSAEEKTELLEKIVIKIKLKLEQSETEDFIKYALWLANLYKKISGKDQTYKEWVQEFSKWHHIAFLNGHPGALLNELWCLGMRAHHHHNITEESRKQKGLIIAKQLFSMGATKGTETVIIYQKECLKQADEFKDVFWLNSEIYSYIEKNTELENIFWSNSANYLNNCFDIGVFPNTNIAKSLLFSEKINDQVHMKMIVNSRRLSGKLNSDDYFQLFLKTYDKDEDTEYFNIAIDKGHELAKFIDETLKDWLPGKTYNPSLIILFKKTLISRTAVLFRAMKPFLDWQRITLCRFIIINIQKNHFYSDLMQELALYFNILLKMLMQYEDVFHMVNALPNLDSDNKEIMITFLKSIAELCDNGRVNYLLYKYYLKNESNNNKQDKNNKEMSEKCFEIALSCLNPFALAEHLVSLVENKFNIDQEITVHLTKITESDYKFTIMVLYFVMLKVYSKISVFNFNQNQINISSVGTAFDITSSNKKFFIKLAALEYLCIQVQKNDAKAMYYLFKILINESGSLKGFPEISLVLKEKATDLWQRANESNCPLLLQEETQIYLQKLSSEEDIKNNIYNLSSWLSFWSRLTETERNLQKIDKKIITKLRKSLIQLWVESNSKSVSKIIELNKEIEKISENYKNINTIAELVQYWYACVKTYYSNIPVSHFNSVTDAIDYYKFIKAAIAKAVIIKNEESDKALGDILTTILSWPNEKSNPDIIELITNVLSNKNDSNIAKNILVSPNIDVNLAKTIKKFLIKVKVEITAAEYFRLSLKFSKNSKITESKYFRESLKSGYFLAKVIQDIFDIVKRHGQISKGDKNSSELKENPLAEIMQLLGYLFIESANVGLKITLIINCLRYELDLVLEDNDLNREINTFLNIISDYPTLPLLCNAVISPNKLSDNFSKDNVIMLHDNIFRADETGLASYTMYKYYQDQINLNNNNQDSPALSYYQKAIRANFPLALIEELICLTNQASNDSSLYFSDGNNIYQKIMDSDYIFSCLIIYLISVNNLSFYLGFSEFDFSKIKREEFLTAEDAYNKFKENESLKSVEYALFKLADQMYEKIVDAPYYLAKILIAEKNKFTNAPAVFLNALNEKISLLQTKALELNSQLAILEKMNTLISQITPDSSQTNIFNTLAVWLGYTTRLTSPPQTYPDIPQKLVSDFTQLIDSYWNIVIQKNFSEIPKKIEALKQLAKMNKIINSWKINKFQHRQFESVIKTWSGYIKEYSEISELLNNDKLFQKYCNVLQLKQLIDSKKQELSSSKEKTGFPLLVNEIYENLKNISFTDEKDLDALLDSIKDVLTKSNYQVPLLPTQKVDPGVKNFCSQLEGLVKINQNTSLTLDFNNF